MGEHCWLWPAMAALTDREPLINNFRLNIYDPVHRSSCSTADECEQKKNKYRAEINRYEDVVGNVYLGGEGVRE